MPSILAPNAVRHVAIIMDGNRRWAANQHLPKIKGHEKGAKQVQTIVEAAIDAEIKYLTLYAFSSENWQRPEKEVSALMHLLERYLTNELDKIGGHGVRLRIIGDRTLLDSKIIKKIEQAEAKTAAHTTLTLHMALSYGGRQEIAMAAEQCANDGKGIITPERLSQYLYTAAAPDPDLLIRTGGEMRISNFLLWQLAYTELYFTDVLWPDFGKEEFNLALEAFQKRERRYGTS